MDAATNHLQGSSINYDVAGNQTNGDAYQWDSVNMMSAWLAGGSGRTWYVYTPDDERIGSFNGVTNLWNWTIRGFDDQVLRNYRSYQEYPTWTWMEDYVYRGDGLPIAAERPLGEGGERHFHLDHLGTPRLVTGAGGAVVAIHDYAPWGPEITSQCQEVSQGFDREESHRFTNHERDFTLACGDNNTLDYMHARYYNDLSARFLSVDMAVSNTHDPSTWNRYSYGANNPLRFVDKNGLSYVVFNKGDNTISLYSRSDALIGAWTAGNRIDSSASGNLAKTGVPSGKYNFLDTTAAHFHPSTTNADTPTGGYGPYGIFRLNPFKGTDGVSHDASAYIPAAMTKVGPVLLPWAASGLRTMPCGQSRRLRRVIL